MALFSTVFKDIQAAREKDPAATSTLGVILTYPGFHALQFHRIAHWLHVRHVPVMPLLVASTSRFITGVEIHPGATIGAGVFIDHGMGVVIGETAEIGEDCHLMQGVTLGGTSNRREKRHPTLGRGVTIGAGAKLIGAITVGDNARIGAGSVVVTNVPAYATVVGVPGKVVAYYDPGNDTIQRLPDPEWDRIEELDRKVQELQAQVAQLQKALREAQAASSKP